MHPSHSQWSVLLAVVSVLLLNQDGAVTSGPM